MIHELVTMSQSRRSRHLTRGSVLPRNKSQSKQICQRLGQACVKHVLCICIIHILSISIFPHTTPPPGLNRRGELARHRVCSHTANQRRDTLGFMYQSILSLLNPIFQPQNNAGKTYVQIYNADNGRGAHAHSGHIQPNSSRGDNTGGGATAGGGGLSTGFTRVGLEIQGCPERTRKLGPAGLLSSRLHCRSCPLHKCRSGADAIKVKGGP